MIPQYSKLYLNTYKQYRDILDTNVTIICKAIASYKPSEKIIYQLKAIPMSREFIDTVVGQANGEVAFFIDELEVLKSLNGDFLFPISDIEKQVEQVRYNNITYNFVKTRRNIFNNTLVFELNRKL